MAYIPNQLENTGLFIGTTQAWDASIIYSMNVNEPEFKELIVKLATTLNNIAQVLNLKASGLFNTEEFQTGETFFSTDLINNSLTRRPVFSKVILCGALPNNGTTTTPHGLPVPRPTYLGVQYYGTATDPGTGAQLCLPYVSVSGDAVEIELTATDIVITTQSDRTAYTNTFVIIRYIKEL